MIRVVLAIVALACASCSRPPSPAQAAALASEVAAKDAADAECLRSASTCEGYVACRRAVAAKYRVSFTGRCVP